MFNAGYLLNITSPAYRSHILLYILFLLKFINNNSKLIWMHGHAFSYLLFQLFVNYTSPI